MDIKTISEILAEHEFFADLKPEYVELISGCGENVRYDRGHFLFNEEGAAEHFYLLNRGQVAIEISAGNQGPITLQHLGAGDILGWSWLMPPYKWQFGALALETTTALRFDAKCVRDKCEADHSLGYELMKRVNQLIAQGLMAARKQLLDYI